MEAHCLIVKSGTTLYHYFQDFNQSFFIIRNKIPHPDRNFQVWVKMEALENVESDEIWSSQQRGRHHEVWFTPFLHALQRQCPLYKSWSTVF